MNSRTVICTLVGVLAVICLLASTPRQHFEPKGILLPAAKTVRAPISAGQVAIYQDAPAARNEDVGQIRVEFAYHDLDDAARDQVLDKVKSLAAAAGANGVVVRLFVPSDGLRPILVFMGEAIYVPSLSARSAKP